MVSTPSAFSDCITAYAASHGLMSDPNEHAGGLEFESEDRVVRILPDLHDASRLCIEVDIRAVSLDSLQTIAHALLLMHRFNDQSRVSQGWQVALDSDDFLMLWRTQALAGLDPREIDGWIEQGLEVADQVDQIWALDPGQPEVAPTGGESRVFG